MIVVEAARALQAERAILDGDLEVVLAHTWNVADDEDAFVVRDDVDGGFERVHACSFLR